MTKSKTEVTNYPHQKKRWITISLQEEVLARETSDHNHKEDRDGFPVLGIRVLKDYLYLTGTDDLIRWLLPRYKLLVEATSSYAAGRTFLSDVISII